MAWILSTQVRQSFFSSLGVLNKHHFFTIVIKIVVSNSERNSPVFFRKKKLILYSRKILKMTINYAALASRRLFPLCLA